MTELEILCLDYSPSYHDMSHPSLHSIVDRNTDLHLQHIHSVKIGMTAKKIRDFISAVPHTFPAGRL
jgi:hypothetical protein